MGRARSSSLAKICRWDARSDAGRGEKANCWAREINSRVHLPIRDGPVAFPTVVCLRAITSHPPPPAANQDGLFPELAHGPTESLPVLVSRRAHLTVFRLLTAFHDLTRIISPGTYSLGNHLPTGRCHCQLVGVQSTAIPTVTIMSSMKRPITKVFHSCFPRSIPF